MGGERKYFFTYVWGPPGEPASPLTFAKKAGRTFAKRNLSEGDYVFTVCTRGDPSPANYWGRVTAVYQVSDMEVDTSDYDLPRRWDQLEYDSVSRFPFALHPISVSEVISKENLFSELVGTLTPRHHLQAQSGLVELTPDVAAPLLKLTTRKLSLAEPKSEFGRGKISLKNSKLAPKHAGSFVGEFRDHDIWYVYVMRLLDRDGKVAAVKVGYANDPAARASAYNMAMASEVTGLRWIVPFKQPCSGEDRARAVEQAVLANFQELRLGSNGEVLKTTDPMKVEIAVGVTMRSMS